MNKNILKHLYNKKLYSLRKIGEMFHKDGTTILWWMKKFNIPRRTRTEVQKGKQSRGWKGGRRKNHNGYILLYLPKYHHTDIAGYVREHIYLVEQYIGRPLTKREIVHHIDGDKSNNYLHNLYVFTNKGLHSYFETLVRYEIINRLSIQSNLNQLKARN